MGSGLSFHPEVIVNYLDSLFSSNSWNIWLFVVFSLFIINIKNIIKSKELIFGWLFLYLSQASVLFVYIFTECYVFALDYTAVARNIMIVVPVSVFLVAVSWDKKISAKLNYGKNQYKN